MEEEVAKRKAGLDAQLKATTAELETTKEDLEDSQELVEQQSLFTDTWQGKFEELKELAKSGGISLAAILVACRRRQQVRQDRRAHHRQIGADRIHQLQIVRPATKARRVIL